MKSRARQQTDHSYAAGLLGTEPRREISSRIKGNLLHDLGSAHGQGRPLPSGQLPWNLPVTGLLLSLSRLAAWNLRKPEIHISIPSLKNLAWAEIKIQDQHAKYWVTLLEKKKLFLPVVVMVYATTFHFDKNNYWHRAILTCILYNDKYLDLTHFEAVFLNISFYHSLILLFFQVLLQSIFFRQ